MRLCLIYLIVCSTLLCSSAIAQVHFPTDTTQINLRDKNGLKEGFWLFRQEARMGEPTSTQFGWYHNGEKEGTWYELDPLGELKSIENYLDGVRNGQSSYYKKGKLKLRGNYRGLSRNKQFDTFVVTDPVSLEEVTRILPTDQGSVMHGLWQYFDPKTGVVIKEEEYQVGDLIARRDYTFKVKMSKEKLKKIEANMPHIQDPTGKKGQRGQRKSLIK